jgi:hypothetical protein
MDEKCSSENLKIYKLIAVRDHAKYIGNNFLYQINKRSNYLFINLNILKDKRWSTAWNHCLDGTNLFFRWIHHVTFPLL